MTRHSSTGRYVQSKSLAKIGLDAAVLRNTVEYVYAILDALDETLIDAGEPRIAGIVELANLSAILGNLFRGGVARESNGRFIANGPHKYPDLLSNDDAFEAIEIKVALEDNKPKGHLAKPGPHLIVRYVLGSPDRGYTRGKQNRGDVVWIWEIRAGVLEIQHFNISSTAGDSGKTAVVNKLGMEALKVVYCDAGICPISPSGRRFSLMAALTDH
jgi:hypothetical protein